MNTKLIEKAQKVAEMCVDEFLENKPSKSDWEKISLIQTKAQHITDVSVRKEFTENVILYYNFILQYRYAEILKVYCVIYSVWRPNYFLSGRIKL